MQANFEHVYGKLHCAIPRHKIPRSLSGRDITRGMTAAGYSTASKYARQPQVVAPEVTGSAVTQRRTAAAEAALHQSVCNDVAIVSAA